MRKFIKLVFITFLIFCFSVSNVFAITKGTGICTLQDGTLTVNKIDIDGSMMYVNSSNNIVSYTNITPSVYFSNDSSYLSIPQLGVFANNNSICSKGTGYHVGRLHSAYGIPSYRRVAVAGAVGNYDSVSGYITGYVVPIKCYYYASRVIIGSDSYVFDLYSGKLFKESNVKKDTIAYSSDVDLQARFIDWERGPSGGGAWSDPYIEYECIYCNQTLFDEVVYEDWNSGFKFTESTYLDYTIPKWVFIDKNHSNYSDPFSTLNIPISVTEVNEYLTPSQINLKNSLVTGYTIEIPCKILSGSYYGPTGTFHDYMSGKFWHNSTQALYGPTSIEVVKASIVDYAKTKTSKYLLGEESEESSVVTDNRTITTVKLSNPPIIIDWGTMPPLDINWDGLDLDFDFNAPTIEVTRNPANQKQPAVSVTLTIRATDPDGNDSPTPISINGGTFIASPATYTVREKEVVNISARDSKGNVRDYSVNVSNIDTEAPYVTSMTQSNTAWTKTPVVVTVKAEDDVKLHATPYKYEFTPNSTGHTTVSGWTANRTFSATENGTLRVGVRDTLYTNDSNTAHFSWSEPYYIRNIDKISPSATVAYSVPSGQKVSEKVGVTVYVTPVDNADRVTGESSGISNTPIAWTEGAFTAQLEKTFYANGTYYFWIKDALGNISARQFVTINQIVSDNSTKPVINSLNQNKATGQVSAPVTITVNASKGPNGPNLSNQPFSWDGGVTWTNNPNFNVNKNGTYTVIVKDTNGNTTEQSITISNIDDNKPTASLFLYKGQPEDWDMTYGPALVTDYVWKLRVDANDLGSGLQQVVTNWDNRTINTPSTPFTTVFDVTEPGVYGVKVVDKCGNETYVEKTITAESIGAGIWGVGGGSTGGTGGLGTGTGGKGIGTVIDVPSTGSAGSSIFPGGASLQDLVFSPNSVYNIATGETKGYPPGKAGIPIHLLFTATRNHYVTGTATFNGVEYPLYFPENGNANWIKSIGRQNVAEGFIPINTVTSDVKNGRIKISFKEYSDQSLTTLVSEGSATLYTSTQVTKPTIGYVYNKATDQLTVNASSTVAGVDKVQVDLGSGYQDYTGPVTVGGASIIKVKVTDKAGNVSEITIDGSTLPLTGSSGGSIPTNDKDTVGATGSDGDTVNSYHTSNRSADIFIVGGNRSNTNSVPDSSIYDLTD